MLGNEAESFPGVHPSDSLHKQNLTDYFLTTDICVI